MRELKSWALILLLGFAIASPAFGWGDEGHRIVARIAARHLTPQGRLRIAAIIRAVPASQDDLHLKSLVGSSGTPSAATIETLLVTIATWPDHMPGGKQETQPWHFIDIGLFEGPSHIHQRCGSGCVNQKIAEIVTKLKANQALTRFPPDKELRLLVHFMGDIHQPLHAATNADAGGNCVKAHGLALSSELHGVWDTALVERVIDTSDTDPATEIDQSLNGKLSVFQALTDPDTIAAESFAIARTFPYGKAKPSIPVIDHFVDLTPSECKTKAPAEINALSVDAKTSFDNQATLDEVREQLYKGGVRLAAVLNQL
jgi:nuclease S1